ncbi:MAG TPA: hypothetical protein PLU26_16235 [Candidatus Competibacter sp.]|nr:hypothetical protein [Candidatus Competibacteraceae bacterium]HAO31757.1 hypothetical protein [Candidatus Competibacteraceae bacterium]HUM95993.1 hypothetical protein [Candidatus Competibacter sp.]
MNIEELESAVTQLSSEKLVEFSRGFEEFMADQWDHQIEMHILAGRLDTVGQRADADFVAGRAQALT